MLNQIPKIEMRKVVAIAIIVSMGFLVACGSQQSEENQEESTYIALDKMNIESLEDEIKKREKALNEDSSGVDNRIAANLMEAYSVYAERFPNRANSADRLFKAAELAMSLNHSAQSIKYFSKVFDDYPEYDKRPYALFLKAFVLENQAKDYDQAKMVYENFIELFPKHAMADDAEYSLKNMGKSPEELIREFERQDSIRAAQESV